MAINDNGTRVQYSASASQTVFAYPFEVFKEADITVEQNSVVISAYTLSGVGTDSGGNVTLTTGATSGDVITIYRDMDLDRDTDYQANGDFLASEVNNDFDRAFAGLQQIESDSKNAIRASLNDTVLTSSNTELANVATRAGKSLGFDSTGLIEYKSVSVVDGDTKFTTKSIMENDTGAVVGTTVYVLSDRANGIFDTVTVGATPNVDLPNGFNIIVSITDATKCFVLRVSEKTTVAEFGASPSASAAVNDSAMQAWLDTSELYLLGSPGSYAVSTPLTSAVSGRIINGNGMKLLTDGTVSTNLLDLQASNQTVENFEFEAAAGEECTGLFIGAYDNCEIRFNKFTNFDGSGGTDKGSGIVTNSLGTGHYIHHNRLTDCHFSHGADQYGSIHCNAEACIIEGNYIIDAQQTCVSVAGGSGQGGNYTQVIDNTMIGKSGATASGGVNFDGYTIGAIVRGNVIRDMAVEGVLIAGSLSAYSTVTSDFVIQDNHFHECVLNEFALQGSAAGDLVRGVISGNKVYRSTQTNQSIVCTYVDHLDVTCNQIYGHDTGYIVTATSKHHNVTGNTFINQDNTAISASASESTYSNNKIWGDGTSTIGISFNAVATAGKISIHGNQVRKCATGIRGTFNAALPVYVFDNKLGNTLDLDYTGELADSSRDNSSDAVLAGEATLSSGSVTVSTSLVLAGDRIEVELKTPGGTRGALYVNSITAASGFVVNSTSGTDTSVIYWRIIR